MIAKEYTRQLRGGPLTVSELASRLDLTLPTVSGVLADLDRAGLVDRQPDPADRRRTIVELLRGDFKRERIKNMRRLLLALLAAVLMGSILTGCRHVGGACDCVDDPGWCDDQPAGGTVAPKIAK